MTVTSTGPWRRTAKATCILAARCWSSCHTAQSIRGKAGKRLPSTAVSDAERRLFGPRQVGLELRTEGGQDLMQQRRVEHGGRFTQRAQRGPSDAELGLHVREGGRLLQAPQARHRRVEKVQQAARSRTDHRTTAGYRRDPARCRPRCRWSNNGPSRRKYCKPWRCCAITGAGTQKPIGISCLLPGSIRSFLRFSVAAVDAAQTPDRSVPLYLAQRSANIWLLLTSYHQAPERLSRT